MIKKFDDYYVVRLNKNEEIITEIKNAAVLENIKSGFFFGLGVGKDLILGYFNTTRKSYVKKFFKGEYEFVSFSGNISQFKNEIVVHCHVTITDHHFNAFGGHLFQGLVSATLETTILRFNKILRRKKDIPTGLNLISL